MVLYPADLGFALHDMTSALSSAVSAVHNVAYASRTTPAPDVLAEFETVKAQKARFRHARDRFRSEALTMVGSQLAPRPAWWRLLRLRWRVRRARRRSGAGAETGGPPTAS